MSAGAVRAPLVIPLRPPGIGVYKSQIDINTRLELISDTPNVDIFFTINGNKPSITKNGKEISNTGTYKFQKPFTLPPGFQTIRALAVSHETGCESNVVTKTFEVSKVDITSSTEKDTPSDEYGFLNELKHSEMKKKKRAVRSEPHELRDFVHQMNDRNGSNFFKCSATGGGISKKNFNDQDELTKENQMDLSNAAIYSEKCTSAMAFSKTPPRLPYGNDQFQLNKLQQQTDVTRCPNCRHPRPLSRSQHFCFHCGYLLPTLPIPIPNVNALEQIGVCPNCSAHVPLNLATCLVCEAPLMKLDTGNQSSQEFRICPVCHTSNPTHITSCVTCESHLPTGSTNIIHQPVGLKPTSQVRPTLLAYCPPQYLVNVNNQHSEPIKYLHSSKSVRFSTCLYCQRENNPDARFCDWCGLEVPKTGASPVVMETNLPIRKSDSYHASLTNPRMHHSLSNSRSMDAVGLNHLNNGLINCSKCDLPNPREANYCSFCGLTLSAPTRSTSWFPDLAESANTVAAFHDSGLDKSTSKPITVPVANVSTQTVGIYYPSSTDLRRHNQQCQNCCANENIQLRDRIPALTAVSPGRGFWRKQLDHIFGHLKLYTSNNTDFRAAVGRPRLGKLLSANIYENEFEAEISLIYAISSSNKTVSTQQKAKTICAISEKDHFTSTALMQHSPLHITNNKLFDNRFDTKSSYYRQDDTVNVSPSARSNNLSVSDQDDIGSCRPDIDVLGNSSHGFNSKQSESGKPKKSHLTGTKEKVKCENTKPNQNGRVKSARKKRTEQLSLLSDGNFGEAGVAMLRDSKLTVSDRNLFNLLCQPTVNPDEIKHAILEGASPNCVNASKETPLICAVRNGHVEAIRILHEAGAHLNETGTNLGNTALHEAVLLGIDGLELVKTLLQCGASVKIVNNRNESAQSIASRLRCEPLIHLFATHIGQLELDRLTEDINEIGLLNPSTDFNEL